MGDKFHPFFNPKTTYCESFYMVSRRLCVRHLWNTLWLIALALYFLEMANHHMATHVVTGLKSNAA